MSPSDADSIASVEEESKIEERDLSFLPFTEDTMNEKFLLSPGEGFLSPQISTAQGPLPRPQRRAIRSLIDEVLLAGSLHHSKSTNQIQQETVSVSQADPTTRHKSSTKAAHRAPRALPAPESDATSQEENISRNEKNSVSDKRPKNKKRYELKVIKKAAPVMAPLMSTNMPIPIPMSQYPYQQASPAPPVSQIPVTTPSKPLEPLQQAAGVAVNPAMSQQECAVVPAPKQGTVHVEYHWQQNGDVLTQTTVEKTQNDLGKAEGGKNTFQWTTKTTTTHTLTR